MTLVTTEEADFMTTVANSGMHLDELLRVSDHANHRGRYTAEPRIFHRGRRSRKLAKADKYDSPPTR